MAHFEAKKHLTRILTRCHPTHWLISTQIPTPADPNMPKIKDCHHHEYVCRYHHHDGHCCEYKCVGSKDSCKALPGGKVESSAGGHAYEDSDGALGQKALAATAVLAGLAF